MLSALAPALAVHDPGEGELPPGKAGEGVETIMNWAAGLGLAACVISFIAAGVMLGLSYFGHGSPKLGVLGFVALGTAVVTGAASLVGGLA